MASDPHNSGARQDSGAETFPLYAKELQYNGGNWNYETANNREVCELTDGTVFDVIGEFDTAKLAPGKTYEVSFTIMLKENFTGFGNGVLLTYKLPNQPDVKQNEGLGNKPKNQFVPLRMVKSFKIPHAGFTGNMILSLSASDADQKKGLVIFEFDIAEK